MSPETWWSEVRPIPEPAFEQPVNQPPALSEDDNLPWLGVSIVKFSLVTRILRDAACLQDLDRVESDSWVGRIEFEKVQFKEVGIGSPGQYSAIPATSVFPIDETDTPVELTHTCMFFTGFPLFASSTRTEMQLAF